MSGLGLGLVVGTGRGLWGGLCLVLKYRVPGHGLVDVYTDDVTAT